MATFLWTALPLAMLSASPQAPQRIEVDSPIERTLAGGEEHAYFLHLNAGQFLRLTVDQRGVDVLVEWIDPVGKKLLSVDGPTGPFGRENLLADAAAEGDYTLRIRAFSKEAHRGTYRLRVAPARPARPQDKSLAQAYRRIEQALLLSRQGTADARHEAIRQMSQVIEVARGSRDAWLEAEGLLCRGRVAFHERRFQEAMKDLRRAAELSSQGDDRLQQATTLYNLGLAHSWLEEDAPALGRFREAAAVFEEIGHLQSSANAWNSAAVALDGAGEVRQAAAAYEKALAQAQRVDAPVIESNILTNLGLLRWSLGDTAKALANFDRALPLARRRADPGQEANTLTNMGVVLWSSGARSEAVERFEEALPLWRRAEDIVGEATTLTNLGAAYRRSGDPRKSLTFFDQALRLYQGTADKAGRGHILSNIGSSYLALGDTDRALEYFEQSLELRRTTGNRSGEAIVHGEIGRVRMARGERAAAARELRWALDAFRGLQDYRREAGILTLLGRLEMSGGNPAAALPYAESSLKLWETLRERIDSHDLRASHMAVQQDAFELCLDVLWELHQRFPQAGYDLRALVVNERRRARTLLEMLQEARTVSGHRASPELRRQERTLRSRLSATQAAWLDELGRSSPDSARLGRLRSRLDQIEKQRQQLDRRLRRRDSSLPSEDSLITDLGTLRGHLTEKDAFLEFFWGSSSRYLFVVTREDFRMIRLDSSAEVVRQIEDFLPLLKRPGRRSLGRYRIAAAALYQSLLAPAEPLIRQKESWILAADGPLSQVPFEALLDPAASGDISTGFASLGYLLRRRAIRYAPSASALVVLEVSRRKEEGHGDGRSPWMGVGAPADRRARSEATAPEEAVSVREGWVAPLPGSEEEILSIARLFESSPNEVLLGERASEENVRASRDLRRAKRLHFSTHGWLRPDRPLYSGLLLTLDDDPAEDGLLQVHEIFDLDLSADLVVLSACETGVKSPQAGGGVLGLPQAFLYAGASSVVMSLWKVADTASADLMVGFYQGLVKGQAAPASLREAKLSLLESPIYAHPYYWAPFIFFGASRD